ncbi:MAG: hypothetical protein ACI4AM_04000 [Muribaculaceae bacterium]
MTLSKKILFWAVVTIVATPGVLMTMNANEETAYFNIIGLAYLYVAVKACKRFMPQWMIDYFNQTEPQQGKV